MSQCDLSYLTDILQAAHLVAAFVKDVEEPEFPDFDIDVEEPSELTPEQIAELVRIEAKLPLAV